MNPLEGREGAGGGRTREGRRGAGYLARSADGCAPRRKVGVGKRKRRIRGTRLRAVEEGEEEVGEPTGRAHWFRESEVKRKK